MILSLPGVFYFFRLLDERGKFDGMTVVPLPSWGEEDPFERRTAWLIARGQQRALTFATPFTTL